MSNSNVKSSVQRQFGDVAAKYASSEVHVAGADLDAMLAAVDLTGDERVLDAGCGAGHASLAFAPQVHEVVAYDLTESMLATVESLANQRGFTNIITRHGDVENLPFSDAEFDLVISRYSAHHWPAPERAVEGFYRVLKPDGAFILSDIVGPQNYAQDTLLQTIELLRDPSHVRDYRISEWQDFMTQAGFKFEVLFKFSIELDFASWIDRMNTPDENAAVIRQVFDDAPAEIQSLFGIEDRRYMENNFVFTIPSAVMIGRR